MPLPPKRLITSQRIVVLPVKMARPCAPPPALVPFSSMMGQQVKPGWVVPSIVTGPAIAGSPGVAGVMVNAPVTLLKPGSVVGILKLITSVPARALDSWMAARRVQTPAAVAHTPFPAAASKASPVELTVNFEGAPACVVRNQTVGSKAAAIASRAAVASDNQYLLSIAPLPPG